MTHIAVILSGCGYLDGAEVRESVITLLELDKQGATVSIFAPDRDQMHVVNHITGEPTDETRNVLIEAARIARGDVKPLSELNASNFDALVIPGGFGVAKNCSDIAVNGPKATINPECAAIVQDFATASKPIGAICIAPALIAVALKGKGKATVTLGDASNAGLIEGLGGTHQACDTDAIIHDTQLGIISTPAYMRDDARLSDISTGISKLVTAVIEQIQARKAA